VPGVRSYLIRLPGGVGFKNKKWNHRDVETVRRKKGIKGFETQRSQRTQRFFAARSAFSFSSSSVFSVISVLNPLLSERLSVVKIWAVKTGINRKEP
jgi:hypothetical protein